MKFGLMLATSLALATTLTAQVPTNIPPAPPAALTVPPPPPNVVVPPLPTNAIKAESSPEGLTTNTVAKPKKAAKTPKKKSPPATVKKTSPKADKPTSAPMVSGEPLVVGESATAIKDNINIRGQAHINSEVVGHLKRGETVTVLEIVTLSHPKTDEPAKWARIALPASLHVWVNSTFVSKTNDTVKVKKLNLRSGPGENYSIIGMLHQGDVVKIATTKGEWTQIEAPTNAFAFVAAHMIAHKEAAPVFVAPPVAQPVETVVPPGQPIATATTEPATNPPVIAPIPAALPAADEPLPKRIVQREGIVGGTVSIQSPTHYQLYSLDNGKVMDYLYANTTNLVIGRYRGMTVLVTGEEELDERWPNTPVITIQKIQVVK